LHIRTRSSQEPNDTFAGTRSSQETNDMFADKLSGCCPQAMAKLPEMEVVMNKYFVAHAEAAGNGLVVLPGVVALLQALKVRQPRLFTSVDDWNVRRDAGFVYGNDAPGAGRLAWTPANLQLLFHQNPHKSARRGEVQHTGGHEWVTAPPAANCICNANAEAEAAQRTRVKP